MNILIVDNKMVDVNHREVPIKDLHWSNIGFVNLDILRNVDVIVYVGDEECKIIKDRSQTSVESVFGKIFPKSFLKYFFNEVSGRCIDCEYKGI